MSTLNVSQKDASQCQHHQQYGQSGEYLASGMPLSVSRYPGRPGRADIHDTIVNLLRQNTQKTSFSWVFGAIVARTSEIHLPMA